MKSMKAYFEEAMKAAASDLHLVAGEKPMLRIAGQLQDIEDKPLPLSLIHI